jgi:hypothetical protein
MRVGGRYKSNYRPTQRDAQVIRQDRRRTCETAIGAARGLPAVSVMNGFFVGHRSILGSSRRHVPMKMVP